MKIPYFFPTNCLTSKKITALVYFDPIFESINLINYGNKDKNLSHSSFFSHELVLNWDSFIAHKLFLKFQDHMRCFAKDIDVFFSRCLFDLILAID
jgi:hypothetical protein